MIGDVQGWALCKKEFVHTKIWPGKQNLIAGGTRNLTKEYKEGLAGQMCPVLDMAVDGSAYLLMAKDKNGNQFVWSIEKGDTEVFLPVKVKNGILMPTNLSPIKEFEWMAKSMSKEMSEAIKKAKGE